MPQTSEQIYDAVGDVIDGNELTDVIKVLIFTCAECITQLTDGEFDARMAQEAQFMLLQSYVALCESGTIPIQ